MKFIVVSDKTIERSIAESQILDNMKSDIKSLKDDMKDLKTLLTKIADGW